MQTCALMKLEQSFQTCRFGRGHRLLDSDDPSQDVAVRATLLSQDKCRLSLVIMTQRLACALRAVATCKCQGCGAVVEPPAAAAAAADRGSLSWLRSCHG